MKKCPNCGYCEPKVKKPTAFIMGDPVADLVKGGWIYAREDGSTYYLSFFLSGKERKRDADKRAKKSLANDTAGRNAKLNALGIFVPHPLFLTLKGI